VRSSRQHLDCSKKDEGIGTVKKSNDGMLQTPGMLMGWLVVWWEDGCEDAELDKIGMVVWLKKGCPGVGSPLVDFGLAVAVAFFAVVARVLFCWSPPQSRSSAHKGDNQLFPRTEGFP